MGEALFEIDGQRFVPSLHTRGPWDARAQHGGPVAALLGRAIEALPSDVPMAVARITVEILRPIPVHPLAVSARVERPGRRVQLLGASVSDDAGEVCRASAWRVRVAHLGLDGTGDRPPVFAGPAESAAHLPSLDEPGFHTTGVQMRFAAGSFEQSGPATVWIRLAMPVIAGEEPSPLQRALAAADFGNGVSSVLPWGTFVFINTDVSVYLVRPPVGEWIGLDATTDVDSTGVGLAQSALWDERGRIGRSLQTLFVDRLNTPVPRAAP